MRYVSVDLDKYDLVERKKDGTGSIPGFLGEGQFDQLCTMGVKVYVIKGINWDEMYLPNAEEQDLIVLAAPRTMSLEDGILLCVDNIHGLAIGNTNVRIFEIDRETDKDNFLLVLNIVELDDYDDD